MEELYNRESLKSFFRKGSKPTEVHFAYLVDSTVNKISDGFSKTVKEGLKLSPTGDSSTVISFLRKITDKHPLWLISLNPSEGTEGLSFKQKITDEDGEETEKWLSRLFLEKTGKIGIATEDPRYTLDINGVTGIKTRVGTFSEKNTVPANGAWQDLTGDLPFGQALEVVAQVSNTGKQGMHASAHVVAMLAPGQGVFGGKKIKVTQAYTGMFWNKLRFKWRRIDKEVHRLAVKTFWPYANDVSIKFHVTNLWCTTDLP